MFSDKVMGVIRAVVAGAGGLLVGIGFATADDWAGVAQSVETILGAIGVIGAAVASVLAKIKGQQ